MLIVFPPHDVFVYSQHWRNTCTDFIFPNPIISPDIKRLQWGESSCRPLLGTFPGAILWDHVSRTHLKIERRRWNINSTLAAFGQHTSSHHTYQWHMGCLVSWWQLFGQMSLFIEIIFHVNDDDDKNNDIDDKSVITTFVIAAATVYNWR